MSNKDYVLDWVKRVESFKAQVHPIFEKVEDARQSRLILLEQTYADLALLNSKQDDLFKQAIRCAENGLYRAAHVMAWAACMDYIEEKLSEDGLIKLRAERPHWKGKTIREIAEYIPERQLVEVMQPLDLTTKNETAAFVSLLQKRNECAHPTAYYPTLNETLGYLSEVIQRVQMLSNKSLH